MLTLIPAYEPGPRLLQLVRGIREQAPHAVILVVDDGSGPDYANEFDDAARAGAHVLRFVANRGKGAALKSGFAWATERQPGVPVVCADSDGQHAVADILRVAEAVQPGTMVLGGREFTGDVPLRSRIGNTASRWAFRLATGVRVRDTQTGLRGYPPELLGWLCGVAGDRFEFESNLLFEARRKGVAVKEIPIATIYLDGNATSHFRPVRDSARIYARLLRFVASSLASAVVDWAGVLMLNSATGSLLLSVVASRILSAGVNFQLNRTTVFGDTGELRVSLRRYLLLAGAVLIANYWLLALLVRAGLALVPAKALVESVLFLVSYVVQQRVVFASSAPPAPWRSAPVPPSEVPDPLSPGMLAGQKS